MQAVRFAPALSIIVLLLSACDGADQPGPGGVSKEDAAALDDAAEKLDSEIADPSDQR